MSSPTNVPPFVIGSDVWPGLAKLAEECGELLQVVGKLMAFPDSPHPDGTNLLVRLQDELADASAAIEYTLGDNVALDPDAFLKRRDRKLDLFHGWAEQERELAR